MISVMTDGCGREIDYVRISVTDRCSLRCIYCMPEEGIRSVSHTEILSFDEIERLVSVFASLGITKIKLTGGEPLVRKDIAVPAGRLKRINGICQVTMTTNGIGLAKQMEALAGAGINGINLSLDTLNPEVFARITRRRAFDQVMEGFYAALQYPQIPLKINCVPMGIPERNVTELAVLAKKYPVHVRYIEMMPIGFGRQFQYCSEDTILENLVKCYGPWRTCDKKPGNGPGHYISFAGFQGKIGFISAISHKFCDSCNRVRLTSQGFLKTCLQYDTGADMRHLLRGGASDEEIRETVRTAIMQKPVSHQFTENVKEHEEAHTMSQIGG